MEAVTEDPVENYFGDVLRAAIGQKLALLEQKALGHYKLMREAKKLEGSAQKKFHLKPL